MNDFDQIKYKGFLIDKFEHPSLYGKYEVYYESKFIGRYLTILKCKKKINERLER
tara:strand:- start:731 stop:895 length:165 start_codon:yes stop_codon:yes gene_type:complete